MITAIADVASALDQGAGQVSLAPDQGPLICNLSDAASRVLAMPFDSLRALHAMAVQWGLVRRSLLATRDVENLLDMFGKLTLGPLARRV